MARKVSGAPTTKWGSNDTYLSLLYAECLEALSMRGRALAEYDKMLSDFQMLRGIIREVAAERGLPVLDVDSLLLEYAFPVIPGYEIFVDGVHLRIAGHSLIGCTLAELLSRESIVEGSTSQISETRSCRALADEAAQVPDSLLGPEALTSMGFSAFNQGRFEEARRLGQAALAMSEDRPSDEMLQTHLLLGWANSRLGASDQAREHWLALKEIWSAAPVE
jgi:tetratricopeptide (TPR) repeat protein